LALLWLVALAAIASYKFLDRTPFRPLIFPPEQPPSVQLLQSELQLKPGEPFRGRVLVLAGMLAPAGDQWPGASGSIQDVLEFHYRTILGNDHYVHLLPFGLSVATDFGHWTSALTFIFLHKFFVRKDDIISNKAFFPLRAFNNRIARLLGIRMVVTDAPTLEDTSLVYETKAGNADLRIFRVDNVNLGQYSPTHPIKVAYASEALSTLAASDFDPQRDAVVEQEAPDNLVKVDSASVITDFGPTLSINAYSSGWSLLVLPFEYSHCLRLETQQGTSGQLFPVNLQQTGLLFERRITARIFYRYGPFDRPQCRRADLDRINRLHLRDAL
jgi:hypothetical protein